MTRKSNATRTWASKGKLGCLRAIYFPRCTTWSAKKKSSSGIELTFCNFTFVNRYTALSVVPAALGKKIREVTTKVTFVISICPIAVFMVDTGGGLCSVDTACICPLLSVGVELEGVLHDLSSALSSRPKLKGSRGTSLGTSYRVEACSSWPKVGPDKDTDEEKRLKHIPDLHQTEPYIAQ